MAGLKTSLGWTRQEERVPIETVGLAITAFFVFKRTTTKRSRSRWAILPRSRTSTSGGPEITGRLGPGSETILLPCSFFFSSRRRHTRYWRAWSSDVCSSDLGDRILPAPRQGAGDAARGGVRSGS